MSYVQSLISACVDTNVARVRFRSPVSNIFKLCREVCHVGIMIVTLIAFRMMVKAETAMRAEVHSAPAPAEDAMDLKKRRSARIKYSVSSLVMLSGEIKEVRHAVRACSDASLGVVCRIVLQLVNEGTYVSLIGMLQSVFEFLQNRYCAVLV